MSNLIITPSPSDICLHFLLLLHSLFSVMEMALQRVIRKITNSLHWFQCQSSLTLSILVKILQEKTKGRYNLKALSPNGIMTSIIYKMITPDTTYNSTLKSRPLNGTEMFLAVVGTFFITITLYDMNYDACVCASFQVIKGKYHIL